MILGRSCGPELGVAVMRCGEWSDGGREVGEGARKEGVVVEGEELDEGVN